MSTNRDTKPVVFINSALSPSDVNGHDVFDYFVTLMSSLSVTLSKEGYDLVLKTPSSYSNVVQEQLEFLSAFESIIKKVGKYYSGIIIAPFAMKSLTPILGKLLADKDPTFPILTIDKGYLDVSEIKYDLKVKHPPPCVICDEKQGGSLAADSLITYYKSRYGRRLEPKVLIVAGLEGSTGDEDSKDRIDGFTEKFKESYPEAKYLHIYAEFKRNKAKEEMLNFIKTSTLRPNGVFCCNDEMALGIRDALMEEECEIQNEIDKLKTQGLSKREINSERENFLEDMAWIKRIKIVGFDGIREAKLLLRQKDKWLLNTVDVNAPRQVKKLVEMFVAFKGTQDTPVIEGLRHPCSLWVKLTKQHNKHS
ncbi:substrate-binding domain-containing protein [Candidatus Dojkabacteria bacterium]|nr:substrate-binding domain-containing protein [Candidatus Dojkabacteria bacterium]